MTSSFQQQLSTLPIPRLTTVLRVGFSLQEGSLSFDKASRLIETWWNKKALPYGQALNADTADLEFQQMGFVVDFARAKDEFVLAMQEPDSSLERTWLCDFAVRRSGERNHFGVRLSYRQPHNMVARPEPRAPRFLKELISTVGAVDVRAMESVPRKITLDDLSFLIDFVSSPNRLLPVIVISEESFTEKVFVDPEKLATTLAGTAHVFQLNAAASWHLSESWNRDISTFNGAVRCYGPNFRKTDDKFKHRLWLPDVIQRLDANSRNGFLNACASHVFTQVTAQFEPQPLLTPTSVRRRNASRPILVSKAKEKAKIEEPSLPAIGTTESPAGRLVQEAFESKIANLDTDNLRLQQELAHLQEKAVALEEARDQERVGRAETEVLLREKEELLSLYEEENATLKQKSDLAFGDAAQESSEALKPLWTSFHTFFNSLQNTATQFRRMETDSNRNVDLTRELDTANQAILTLQAKLDSLDRKRDKEIVVSPVDEQIRNELVRQVGDLAQRNPSLLASLRVVSMLFADRIIVLAPALASAAASSVFKHGDKAWELLACLATEYWETIQQQGDTEARKLFGSNYAPRESNGSLSKAGVARRTFLYKGLPLLMEKHLKIGVSDNAADTLRVHFEWLAEDKQIVIGHCGRHLDF